MLEMMLDAPDYEDYEAEEERLSRLRKRLAHEFDIAEERMDKRNEFI